MNAGNSRYAQSALAVQNRLAVPAFIEPVAAVEKVCAQKSDEQVVSATALDVVVAQVAFEMVGGGVPDQRGIARSKTPRTLKALCRPTHPADRDKTTDEIDRYRLGAVPQVKKVDSRPTEVRIDAKEYREHVVSTRASVELVVRTRNQFEQVGAPATERTVRRPAEKLEPVRPRPPKRDVAPTAIEDGV